MRVMVTGCTGTLGKHLVRELLKRGNEVVGISRDELKQSEYPIRHPDLRLVLCDIRDRERLIQVSRGIELVFHTAALKQVPALEANPHEAIATNILGTKNLMDAQQVNGIERVVLSSTDKACYPINIYGMTKASAEKLVLANSPRNVVVRYGNVIGSRGSVVQMFADSLRQKAVVNLTDPLMTRFWLTQDQAAEFTVQQGLYGESGLQVPSIQASPVTWLAKAVAEAVGVERYETNIIGIRPGEKLHETMRAEHEGDLMYSGDPSCWCPKGFLLSAVTQLLGETV